MLSPRMRGWAVALIAVLSIAPDSMLLHFIRLHSPVAAAHDLILLTGFIRSFFMFTLQTIYATFSAGGPTKLMMQLVESWRALILPAACVSLSQIGLITCFLTT